MRGDVLPVDPLLKLVIDDGLAAFQSPALLGNLSRGNAFDAIHGRDNFRSASEWRLGWFVFHDP